MGVSGALLNGAIPASPVSWLFLIPIGMSSATVWQGWGLRNTYTTRYHFPIQTHFLLPPAALVPQAGHSMLRYGAALLPGLWTKKWFLHLEALAGDWRGEDHEGIHFILPGLFWPPGHLCHPPGGDRVCQKAHSYSHSSFSWASSSVLLPLQAKGTSQFWVVFPKPCPHLVNSPSLNSPSSPM